MTALEFDLYPVSEVYAGVLFFPYERSSEVLHAWREWRPSVPDEVTSVGRMLQFPPIPDLPEFLRGQSFVVVEAAFLGSEADGRALMKPLRDLGPAMDTFAMRPPVGLAELHMDPPNPVPYVSNSMLTGDLSAKAIDEFLAVTGPGSGSPLVSASSCGTSGGALGRTGSAPRRRLDSCPAASRCSRSGWRRRPRWADDAGRSPTAPRRRSRRTRPATTRTSPRRAAAPAGSSAARPGTACARSRAQYDPENLFRANHPIPPAERRPRQAA